VIDNLFKIVVKELAKDKVKDEFFRDSDVY
jgi:hypothetical protein